MDYIYGLLGIAPAVPVAVATPAHPTFVPLSLPVSSAETVVATETVVPPIVTSETVAPAVISPVIPEMLFPTETVEVGLEKPVLTREEPSKEEFSLVLSRMFDVHVNRSKMFEELKTRFHPTEVKEAKEEEVKWCDEVILPKEVEISETEVESLPSEVEVLPVEANLNQNPFSEFMKDTMISQPLMGLPPFPSLPPLPLQSRKVQPLPSLPPLPPLPPTRSKDTFTILGRNVLLLKQIKEENDQVLHLEKQLKEKDAMILSLTKAVKHKETLLNQSKKKMEGVALHAQKNRDALERTLMEQSVKAKEMQIQIRQLEKKHRTKCRDLKIKHPDNC